MRTKNQLKAWLGVDPGKTGAACLLTKRARILFFDWPKSDSFKIVSDQIYIWSNRYDIKTVVLEKVSSMPKQGVKSMFTFGGNYRAWEMLIVCCHLPMIMPTPQKWQKGVGITKSDGPDPKSRALNVASRLFPNAELTGPRGGALSGRADALLMAYYGKIMK